MGHVHDPVVKNGLFEIRFRDGTVLQFRAVDVAEAQAKACRKKGLKSYTPKLIAGTVAIEKTVRQSGIV